MRASQSGVLGILQDRLVVWERDFASHYVIPLLLLLVLLFLPLLVHVGFLQTLLRHRLTSVDMVGKILLGQIRRRVGCGDHMVRDLLRALG